MAHKSKPGDGGYATGDKGCGGNLIFGTEAENEFLTVQGRDGSCSPTAVEEATEAVKNVRKVGDALRRAEGRCDGP